jgi:ferredoxin
MLYIDERECIRCGACVEACPTNAISPGNSRNPKVLRAAMIETSGLDARIETKDLPFAFNIGHGTAPDTSPGGAARKADVLTPGYRAST